jgi:DNA-binding MarR family transcriptional regulator
MARGGTVKNRSEATDRYDLDENAGRLLLLGFRVFERALLRYTTEQGFGDIRMSHLPIMRGIRLGVTRTTQIAEMAKITKQTAGGLISELEAMRYIKRFSDPVDGRAKLVRFAERGRDFMAQFPAALKKAETDIMAIVGATDFEKLIRILVTLVASSGDDTPAAMPP